MPDTNCHRHATSEENIEHRSARTCSNSAIPGASIWREQDARSVIARLSLAADPQDVTDLFEGLHVSAFVLRWLRQKLQARDRRQDPGERDQDVGQVELPSHGEQDPARGQGNDRDCHQDRRPSQPRSSLDPPPFKPERPLFSQIVTAHIPEQSTLAGMVMKIRIAADAPAVTEISHLVPPKIKNAQTWAPRSVANSRLTTITRILVSAIVFVSSGIQPL
ncbi:MAG: hypothetical protein ACTIA6_14390 [Pseudoclavibacter sp.]